MEQNGSRLDRIEHLVESLGKSGVETDRRLEALGEKTDRRINALLEMMAQLETAQRSTHERVDEVFHGLESLVLALDRYAESTQVRMNALAESTQVRIDALAEAQRRTETNLNALISVVDGLVRRPPQ